MKLRNLKKLLLIDHLHLRANIKSSKFCPLNLLAKLYFNLFDVVIDLLKYTTPRITFLYN